MASLSLEDSVYAFLVSFELFWFATCLGPGAYFGHREYV